MKVLQIGADRSKRGILVPGSAAYLRQKAYAVELGTLEIIGFSLRSDGFFMREDRCLRTLPTNSRSKLFFGLDAIRIARRLPRTEVISVQDPFETGLVAWWIARMWKVPLHVQIHTDFLSPEYAQHSITNRIRVFLAGFILRRASRIRVVSERIKASLVRTYTGLPEITVLPIFAEFKAAETPDPKLVTRFEPFEKVVLVVARLEPEKDVELAIKVFAAASPENSCLVIVGDGSQREYLEKLARTCAARDRIFFEGQQEASLYYPLADVVMVTSRYEGYGLVIVEPLARGIPVISTDVGVAREAGAIVGHRDELDFTLNNWFKNGPTEGKLIMYPYKDFNDYVAAYCADIMACAVTR
ncbi:MAG: hypothetical protein JWM46_301 [Candidatus Kaiserbacteria bacterium]|nr:hypothetical protein [Candidatus Kaiserbacteria bacterium]